MDIGYYVHNNVIGIMRNGCSASVVYYWQKAGYLCTFLNDIDIVTLPTVEQLVVKRLRVHFFQRDKKVAIKYDWDLDWLLFILPIHIRNTIRTSQHFYLVSLSGTWYHTSNKQLKLGMYLTESAIALIAFARVLPHFVFAMSLVVVITKIVF